jgi:hypothetical protein
MSRLVACVDFGSTFTKALLVDVDEASVVASAGHATTIATDVLDGWHACRSALAVQVPAAVDAEVLACSSAGGGLRVAVVGNEDLVTAEAGRRVALSSGGTVVHVGAGGLAGDRALDDLRASQPDLVLLVGGTDGGNADVLIGAAERLAAVPWPGPVVVAGNADATPRAAEQLQSAGIDATVADNVVPQIGVLAPGSARVAIRETFLAHVIGGKHLSASPAFLDMVRGPTPDVVLTGVQLLATGLGPGLPGVGDVAVVDVGGATTDVHSVVELDPEDGALSRQVVAVTPVTRSVEATWACAGARSPPSSAGSRPASWLSTSVRLWRRPPLRMPGAGGPAGRRDRKALDLRLAELALGVALRRHAGRQRVAFGPGGRLVERDGIDLREVALLVGSGGVLRHSPPRLAEAAVRSGTGDPVPGDGCCRARRAWSSTARTCSWPPVCSPRSIHIRRTRCCVGTLQGERHQRPWAGSGMSGYGTWSTGHALSRAARPPAVRTAGA